MPSVNSTITALDTNNAIFDLAPFPMWIYDLDTLKFLAVNQEAIRHYGYSREEFLKMTLRDIRQQEDIPLLEKAIKEARIRTETYKQSLFKHTKKDGSNIWVQLKANLIEYQGKKGELITAVDLTDRYLQEKYIEEQKQYLSTMGAINEILLKTEDWAQALKACFDIVGNFLNLHRIYFFPANNRLLAETHIAWAQEMRNSTSNGSNASESRNTPFSQLRYFLNTLKKEKMFQAVVANLPPSPYKKTLIGQNVKSFLVLPVLAKDNLLGYVRLDDFKSKRNWDEMDLQLLNSLIFNLGPLIMAAEAHQNLLKSEARFRSLVQNGNDLTAILSSKGDIKYVSPTIFNVLGIAPETLLGTNALKFVHEDDASRVGESLALIATQKWVSISPYRFLDVQKNWRWLRTNLSDHLDDPAIEGVVVNSWDVTPEMEKRQGELLLMAMTKMICQPGSLTSCLDEGLPKLIAHTQINISEVWLVSKDNSHLHLISKSFQDKKFEAFYLDRTQEDTRKKGQGLPGQIWQLQKTCSWDNLPANKDFSRSRLAGDAQLQSAIGVPIIYNEEFLGCFICFSQKAKDGLKDHEKLLTELGWQIGPVIKQKIIEEEYRSFFNIAPDPQCIIGYDNYIKKFNSAFSRLLEYGEEELLTQPFTAFLHPDDKAPYETRLRDSIAGAPTRVFEGRFLTKNGEVKWLVWSGTRIPEEKIIIAAAQDVTAKKKAEQDLKTAYERLQTAQKIAKLGYWVRNLDSEYSEWSDETYRIYGHTPETFVPTLQNITQTFHPDDRHFIDNDPNEQLVPGIIKSFDSRILTSSNDVKWIRQEIRLLADENNVPYRIEGTIQDITEKKEQELQLTLSNERFKLAMKASNEMIWEIDCSHQRVVRGKGYEKSIPYESSEPFNKNNSWFKRIYPTEIDSVWHSLHTALHNKEVSYWNMDYRMFRADGSLAYFMDRCFIVRDEKGQPLQCVGSALDVTTTIQQLEKIESQNENLREIAWLQSHVIRAPLTRILGLIYLAKEHKGGGKSLEEIFEMVAESAEELDKAIHEIILKTDTLQDDETDFTH